MRNELLVPATTENVRLICDFVRAEALRLRLAEDVVFDVDLAVEEACINVVRHAYEPGQAGEIRVRVDSTDREMRITLTDWGRPFDADEDYLAVDVPAEVRAEGGMGLLLVHETMDEVSRTTASTPGGPNVLTMVKHTRP